jgi:D-alanine--poly(phosphoribitol) ligase subunit 1
VLSYAGISPSKSVNSITKEERGRLLRTIKALPLKLRSLRGFEEAIITSGGVDLSEINPKTMESKKIKGLRFCGEVLDVDVVRKIYDRFSNVKVINAYGPTEATSAVSSIVITREMLDFERLPVGEVSKCNNNIVICDKEIVIKGKSVFNGYLGEIVGGYFLEDNINCYKTGDLGIIDGDYLYCLGRSDNQIKLNGYRIELEEIEKVINNIVGVNNSCVIAKRDNSGKVKCLKAYVCGEVDLDEVNSWLTSKLPSYMVPKFIEKVSSLPVNNNGKLDRKKIESL